MTTKSVLLKALSVFCLTMLRTSVTMDLVLVCRDQIIRYFVRKGKERKGKAHQYHVAGTRHCGEHARYQRLGNTMSETKIYHFESLDNAMECYC